MFSKPMPPISLHCDSLSAIERATNNEYNGKSRHTHRRHKYVKILLISDVITLDYVRSKENIADPLTKGLSRDQVEFSSRGM